MTVHEPGDVLSKMAENVCEAVSAKAASVVIPDKDGRQRRLATAGAFNSTQHSSILVGTDSMVSEVMQSNQPNLIEDLHRQADPAVRRMIEMGIEAAGLFPLRLGDKSIGAMWIFYEKPHHFPRAEVNALHLYVNQAAISYDNARRTRELTHLRQAAKELAQAAEVRQVLQQIVKSARHVFEADSAVIWSFDATRRVFDDLVADSVQPVLWEKFRNDVPRPDGTAATVIRQGYLAEPNVEHPQDDHEKGPSPRLRSALNVKSFQGIALVVEGEPLGVLYVNHSEPRGFDKEDETTLRTFAYDAALALKKARLMARLQKVHNAARIIAEASVLENLQASLAAIAKGTKDALHCDVVTLYTYDQEKDEIVFPPAMVGVTDEASVLRFGYVAKNSLIPRVLKQEEDLHMAKDAPSDPIVGGPFVRREGIKSSVSIPLKVGNSEVGVMFVNYRTSHDFGKEELDDIRLFARQAAVAICNAQLYENAMKNNAYLQAFYDTSEAVSGTLVLQEILDQITRETRSITKHTGKQVEARFSYLALVEENKLKMMSAYPSECLQELQRVADNLDFEQGKRIGITGRVVKSGVSQLVPEVNKHPDYFEGISGIKSELAVPIKIKDQTIGVIDVEHDDFDAFGKDDQQALEALAAHAAIAIQNAKQFEELKRTYEELERTQSLVEARTALARLGLVSSTWAHAIEGHAETILEDVQALSLALAPETLTEISMKKLNRIEKVAKKILEKPITPPTSSEDGVEFVALNDLIRGRLAQLKEDVEISTVQFIPEFTLRDSITVCVSPEWLRRAFDIVVDNAVKAVKYADIKRVVIITRQTNSWAEIVIKDTGEGIPDDLKNKIFSKPIQNSKNGLGVGLLIAQIILQAYGGEIQLGSTDKTGTTMNIRLPLKIQTGL